MLNENRTKEEAKESSRQKTRERLTKYRKPSQPPPQKLASRQKTDARKSDINPDDMKKMEPVKDKSRTEMIQQKVGTVVSEVKEGMPAVTSSPEPDNLSRPVRISLGRISSSDISVHAGDNWFDEKPNRQRPVTSHSKPAAFRSKIAPVGEDGSNLP